MAEPIPSRLSRPARYLVPAMLALALGACGEGSGAQHGLLGHWLGGGLFGEVDLCLTSVDPVEARVTVKDDEWLSHGTFNGSRLTLESGTSSSGSFHLDLVWDGKEGLSGLAKSIQSGYQTDLGAVQFTRLGGC